MSAQLLAEYHALEEKILGALRSDLTDDEFNSLALEIHVFQRRWNAPYDAWCSTRPTAQRWEEIPAVPQAMFKRFRITCIPPELTTKTFRTSGTTGETRGEHHLLDTRLYEAAALAGWRKITVSRDQTVFLTPSPLEVSDSSLAHMFGAIAETLPNGRFGEGNFFCNASGQLDSARLNEFLTAHAGESISILGTALSFLNYFEWLGNRNIALNEGSFALETGGFKGSGRDIAKADLYALFSQHLGLAPDRVWNEYGMCELASQFYTAGLNAPHQGGPWIRARVVSPQTRAEVPVGETGILHIYDLANLSSVLAIETADFAVRHQEGFILLGRDPGATPRGCSRSADEAMRSPSPAARGSVPARVASQPPIHFGNTRQRAEVIAKSASAFPFLGEITADGLMELARAELGHEDALDRFVPRGRNQARAVAPNNILHILSRNTPAAALQTLIRGLLLGSTNRCKLPTGGLPAMNEFVASLPENWRGSIELSEELPDAWLAEADAVIVFGSDQTIDRIHARVRPEQIFVPHGHKVSIALVLDDPIFASAVPAARDVSVFDQQGCLSPIIIYVRESEELTVEAYAGHLAETMGAYAKRHPPEPLTLSEANAIHAIREATTFRAANGEPLKLHTSTDTTWTVIADRSAGIPESPLNRVIHVKPFQDSSAVEPLRAHLSTVGIWPNDSEGAEIAARLGALRICPIGKMQQPPLTWHHDGRSPLADLVRWVDWELH